MREVSCSCRGDAKLEPGVREKKVNKGQKYKRGKKEKSTDKFR